MKKVCSTSEEDEVVDPADVGGRPTWVMVNGAVLRVTHSQHLAANDRYCSKAAIRGLGAESAPRCNWLNHEP